MDAPKEKTSNDLAEERTSLAYERTILANDRTLMAWIRTSLSLTSFGFTFYKFFSELVQKHEEEVKRTFFSPRVVGMILIALGFFGLLFALLSYYEDIKRFKELSNVKVKPFTPIFAVMLLLLSATLFFVALFRQ